MNAMVVALLATLAAFESGHHEKVRPAGKRPFGIGVVLKGSVAGMDTVGTGDTLTLQVRPKAQYSGTVSVRIHIPPEIKLLAGDPAQTLPISRHSLPIVLQLSAAEAGYFEVRGIAEFKAQGSRTIDEAEFAWPVRVDGEKVMTGPVEYLRAERVLDGERYRYSRGWLIPVEEPTRVIDAEIKRRGEGPAVESMVGANCGDCLAVDDTVMFVAAISANGKLLGARAVGLPGRDELPSREAVRAARLALDRWQFTSAEFRGNPVAAWLYVRVPVNRGP